MTGGDTHAAADIICYMNGYKDNRREKFFTKSEWAGQDYVGMRRGIVIPELKTTGHKYSGVNIAPTSPLYWMNAAEVAFLRAEGQAVLTSAWVVQQNHSIIKVSVCHLSNGVQTVWKTI